MLINQPLEWHWFLPPLVFYLGLLPIGRIQTQSLSFTANPPLPVAPSCTFNGSGLCMAHLVLVTFLPNFPSTCLAGCMFGQERKLGTAKSPESPPFLLPTSIHTRSATADDVPSGRENVSDKVMA